VGIATARAARADERDTRTQRQPARILCAGLIAAKQQAQTQQPPSGPVTTVVVDRELQRLQLMAGTDTQYRVVALSG